jgi:hypothetical protein
MHASTAFAFQSKPYGPSIRWKPATPLATKFKIRQFFRALVTITGRMSKRTAALFACVAMAVAHAEPPVTSATETANFATFNQWMAEVKGCQNVHSFSRPDVNRGVVEAVLTCQALKLGGYDGEFKLVLAPNYTRAMLMAAEGEATMPSESLWTEDLDEHKFYATKPLLMDGDSPRGIYVRADKVKRYTVKTLADLRKLKAVMSSNWIKDWATLKDMAITTEDAGTGVALLKMVGADRAQFTLFGFNANPEFELFSEGIKFVPLPGVKISLHGERRMAVSKAAPNGLEVFNALNKGIEILLANGTIARAWRESGYINKRTDAWVTLN